MEKEFFESKQQSLQDVFDEKLKKFTNELGAKTTAIIEQCMESTASLNTLVAFLYALHISR